MEISRILNILTKYGLTADELLLVRLTFLARDEEGHPEYFKQWYSNGGKEQLKTLFESLQNKGIILKSYNPKGYVPNDIEFNKNFLKSWQKNSLEMGEELFNEYPPYIRINGSYIPIKDVSKRFASLNDFFFFYSKEIGHDPEKHEEVMKILRWAKENGQCNISLLNFVISHQWQALQELKENPEIVPTVNSILQDV